MSSTKKKFGKRLRYLRKKREMSQEKLAEATGLHVNTIGQMERGEVGASFETLDLLSKALKFPIKAFFDYE